MSLGGNVSHAAAVAQQQRTTSVHNLKVNKVWALYPPPKGGVKGHAARHPTWDANNTEHWQFVFR
jgi:hypothetical protein